MLYSSTIFLAVFARAGFYGGNDPTQNLTDTGAVIIAVLAITFLVLFIFKVVLPVRQQEKESRNSSKKQ
ncbi:MAG TPA: hypothetical protein PLW44_12910 [Chitinophagales bacterium]|nr:hypothetical protein [Chitinophagales bacterium]